MGAIADAILTVPNITLMLAVGGILVAARRSLRGLWKHPVLARVEPFLAPVLCVIGMFIPQAGRENLLIGDRIMIGLALGTFAMAVYKIAKQAVLGHDARIKKAKTP